MNKTLGAALVVGAVCLTGCGTSTPTYDDYAAICVDGSGNRVEDSFCPIGDGEPDVPNYPWGWGYYGYNRNVGYLDIPLVGYPVNRTVFVSQRPVNISTTIIKRGDWPTAAPPGTTGNAAKIRIDSATGNPPPPGSSSVKRGGLGVGAQIVTDKKVGSPAASPAKSGPGPVKRAVAKIKAKVTKSK